MNTDTNTTRVYSDKHGYGTVVRTIPGSHQGTRGANNGPSFRVKWDRTGNYSVVKTRKVAVVKR